MCVHVHLCVQVYIMLFTYVRTYVTSLHLLLTHRILYVITHSGIVEQYRMDGQGEVIKIFDEFEDDIISAMTIDYENNQLYLRVDRGNRLDDRENNRPEPYAISRTDYDFTNLRGVIYDLRPDNYYLYGYPLPAFAVHDQSLYLTINNLGLVIVSLSDNTVIGWCHNQLVRTPVYSTKVIHYGRQPGKHYFYWWSQ